MSDPHIDTVWLVDVNCETHDSFFLEPVVELGLILLELLPRSAAFLLDPAELYAVVYNTVSQ